MRFRFSKIKRPRCIVAAAANFLFFLRKNHLADVLEKMENMLNFSRYSFCSQLISFPHWLCTFLLTIGVICPIHVFVMETLDRWYERYLLSPKGYSGRRITVVINTWSSRYCCTPLALRIYLVDLNDYVSPVRGCDFLWQLYVAWILLAR